MSPDLADQKIDLYGILKNPVFGHSVFRLKLNFLHKNNYPDLHHSQGYIKFATEISPLLNCELVEDYKQYPVEST